MKDEANETKTRDRDNVMKCDRKKTEKGKRNTKKKKKKKKKKQYRINHVSKKKKNRRMPQGKK